MRSNDSQINIQAETDCLVYQNEAEQTSLIVFETSSFAV